MKLFSKAKKTDTLLLAVADGEVVPLSAVPDEAFACGMLGEGFAVEPSGNTVFAPIGGVIGAISEQRHAYTISCDIGDILIHIGIDSIKHPEAFKSHVKLGDRVSAGERIASFDRKLLLDAGICCTIPVLITEPATAAKPEIKTGAARGGRDAALFLVEQERDKDGAR